jgi:hypothetical protein
MQYQVPQFIEVEDKIFGPLTLKQFIYLIAAGGITLICVSLLPLVFAIMAALPFVLFGVALAFYKVNDRPLIIAIEHGFKFFMSNKLYLWKQRQLKASVQSSAHVSTQQTIDAPGLTQSKLKDLAWSLNIKDHMRDVEPQRPQRNI